jgi:hypothetical protein
MSRLAVRQAFRNELTTFVAAHAPVAVFHDSVNLAQRPTDPLWCTATFFTDYSERLCYTSDQKRIEYGSVDMIVMAKAGQGDSAAVQLAEDIGDHFRDWQSGTVQVTAVIGPSEFTNSDARHAWYGVAVRADYEHTFS